eukprot:TRINITY_DN14643_c1_g1_i1.p1 TRINITY_DN14643_c1_g1~~TRINITY_DN14643_c1_g1_i1.p1  ORF type:complete len:827 (-),score=85.35 TRINITY_DN14643_c1_g1_i1:121-2601(-)
MGGIGRSLVLHREGSLLNAVSASVTACHTVGWNSDSSDSSSHKRCRSSLQSCIREEVRFRSERHRALMQACGADSEHEHDNQQMFAAGTAMLRRLEDRTLDPNAKPEALEGFRLLLSFVEPSTPAQNTTAPRQAFKVQKQMQGGFDAWTVPTPSPRSVQLTSAFVPPKIRQMSWRREDIIRKREWMRSCNLSWGDRTNQVLFRRQLLNPRLLVVGASRAYDTCAFWTGTNKEVSMRATGLYRPPTAEGSEHMQFEVDSSDLEFMEPEHHARNETAMSLNTDGGERKNTRTDSVPFQEPFEDESLIPDFVTFPPHGICPLDIIGGTLATWSIMPDSQRFQPTQELQVRMWRVRLIRQGHEDHLDEFGRWHVPTPIDSERLQEVAVPAVTCDCTSRGNPFCIIFRPKLDRLVEGDQFEVELTGLRGPDQSRSFFYDFRSFRADRQDFELMHEVRKFKELLNDKAYYKEPAVTLRAQDMQALMKERRQAGDRVERPKEVPPDMGLVTHQSQVIQLGVPNIRIVVTCNVAALNAHLALIQSTGRREVKRAAKVIKIGDRFMICVKIPTAASSYELSFYCSTHTKPGILQPHAWTYTLIAGEGFNCPLTSPEHPLRSRFGYCPLTTVAKLLGVTIIAPFNYAIRTGYVYFLVQVDPNILLAEDESHPRPSTNTSSEIFRMLQEESAAAAETKGDGEIDDFHESGSKGGGSKKKVPHYSRAEGETGYVWKMQDLVRQDMDSKVQDMLGRMHFEISVIENESRIERYTTRLQQREGFPQLFDGLVAFSSFDNNCRVEMLLRVNEPNGQGVRMKSLKISEWTVVPREEILPPNL